MKDGAEKLKGFGYAGINRGLNNPAMEQVPFVGPLPKGIYEITGHNSDIATYNILLEKIKVDSKRDSFRIHGGKPEPDRTASQGCTILDLTTRKKILASKIQYLEVVK
ncbi:DUF2778 domain-containing protein [Geovibrio thiophilus]|uniref:DUF2778 domain-containing protein n=1 Tax=Geovibrio thiophilus TaxID=139438 RepID=A0A410JZD5_9BACT|nr:tlde1 domain-containing protein [Geovibrio thiophilus]QAR33411.1 DUF2778 domain-containing protein [Geovibrio thiophilus]